MVSPRVGLGFLAVDYADLGPKLFIFNSDGRPRCMCVLVCIGTQHAYHDRDR